ncbi:MAG: hypothetical protein D6797_01675 [Bdellovibrio sp.]|nr:MAG: hypothetical protein D6797_01675 [Bdellovibrio sp.]
MSLDDQRYSQRKRIDAVKISDLTSLNSYMVIAEAGNIVDASITGFLIRLRRQDLVPKELKQHLSLDSLVGQQVVLYLPQMNLDLDGIITRTRHIGGGVFDIGVEFSQDVPEYWRQCLVDLFPEPGEFSEEEASG